MTESLAIVDLEMCHRVGAMLEELEVPEDKEDVAIDAFSAPEVANFFLMVVAICHQTQSLHGHIENAPVRGWDYLWRRMLQSCRDKREWLVPDYWASVSPPMLQTALYDSVVGHTLQRAEERAALIQNLGSEMQRHHWESAEDIYKESKQLIGNKTDGMLHYLGLFQAYDDPVNKKAYYFLGLMQNSNSWAYRDPENLGAPVDYHEIRGHIRIGTVLISDATLRRKLLQREQIGRDEDIAIRTCVRDAIQEIAKRCKSPSMRLHYLFWNLFRNVCRREKPYCIACHISCGLPNRYQHLIRPKDGMGSCPFVNLCHSANSSNPVVEYQIDTTWY